MPSLFASLQTCGVQGRSIRFSMFGKRESLIFGSVHGRGVISGGIGGGKTRRSGGGVGVVTAAGGLGWSCSTSR